MNSSNSLTQKYPWKIQRLAAFHCIVFFLLASLLFPFTANIWVKLDTTFFYLLNHPLKNSNVLRIFWALANHSMADWLEDLCILGFYIAAIASAKKDVRQKKMAEFFFCVLFIACTILLMNRFLCRDVLHLRRQSPSLVFNDAVILSDFLPWIETKIYSSKSFPSDHGTTALMFACSYAYFTKGNLARLALFYGFFLCLPRLAVGAHWLSDLIVGSVSILLIAYSWAFYSPFGKICVNRFEKIQKKIKSVMLWRKTNINN